MLQFLIKRQITKDTQTSSDKTNFCMEYGAAYTYVVLKSVKKSR